MITHSQPPTPQTTVLDRTKTYTTILIAVFIGFGILNLNDFPYLGITISFILINLYILFTKQEFHRPVNYLALSIALVSAGFITIRVHSFLTFLNVISSIYFTSIFATQSSYHLSHPFNILISPFTVIVSPLIHHASYTFPKLKHHSSMISQNLIGFFVAIISLIIIIPLLASANPFFNELVFDLLDFSNIFEFSDEDLVINGLRILLTLTGIAYLPKLYSYLSHLPPSPNKPLPGGNLIIPKVSVSVILIIFFLTQIQLYFATPEMLANLEYSNWQRAQEVFLQLGVVSFILLMLNYFDIAKPLNRQLAYLLLAQCFFLNLVALKSVIDYTIEFGLTYKRLWGYTGVFWLSGIITIFLYYRNLHSHIFSKVIYFSGMTLILINVINFDGLTYTYNINSRSFEKVDHEYLVDLTSDSMSYHLQFQLISKYLIAKASIATTPSTLLDEPLKFKQSVLRSHAGNLHTKYSNLDWRTFNLSEYRQYLLTRSYYTPPPNYLDRQLDSRTKTDYPF